MNDKDDDFQTISTAERLAEEFSFQVVGEIEHFELYQALIKQAFLAGYEAAISLMEV